MSVNFFNKSQPYSERKEKNDKNEYKQPISNDTAVSSKLKNIYLL